MERQDAELYRRCQDWFSYRFADSTAHPEVFRRSVTKCVTTLCQAGRIQFFTSNLGVIAMRYNELSPAEGWYWAQSVRQGKPSWTMALLKSNGYLPRKLLTIGDLSMLDDEDETKWQRCETINALWLHDEDANVWRRGNQQWSGPTL